MSFELWFLTVIVVCCDILKQQWQKIEPLLNHNCNMWQHWCDDIGATMHWQMMHNATMTLSQKQQQSHQQQQQCIGALNNKWQQQQQQSHKLNYFNNVKKLFWYCYNSIGATHQTTLAQW